MIKNKTASLRPKQIHCNICGSKDKKNIYKLTNSHIVQCAACHFHYIYPRISSKILAKKIQQWSLEDTVDNERLRLAFDKNTLNLYQRFIDLIAKRDRLKDKKLLDIGCSVGAFLSVVQQAGYQPFGLELGKAAAKYAEQKKQFHIFNQSLFEAKIASESYEVVSMLEVIEHLEDPKKAIQMIHQWLKPDGLLFITTPNFDSLFQRLHGEKWWVINCEEEHIMFFDLNSLTRLLEENGFKLEYQQIRGIDIAGILRHYRFKNNHQEDYYDAREGKENIKNALSSWRLDGLIRIVLRCFDWLFSQRFSPFFGMGEQLIVVARKK